MQSPCKFGASGAGKSTPGHMRLARCDFSFGVTARKRCQACGLPLRVLGGHPVFDQPNNRRQDRAGDAAACGLTNKRTDVNRARGLSK